VLKRVLKIHGMTNMKEFAEAYLEIGAKGTVCEWFGLVSLVENEIGKHDFSLLILISAALSAV
jgi:hypothetical protein